ncbi:hypothetical protein WR25_04068 [Diploscapter pachys]|uniref:Uncharacterized protein n=1 Tax=Diploscapter pachys TaxID=2018661 RepID=A0A2A2J582_9BILA|nr:hypothetical protein WR25_04068 [Diploscapter pachys]
MLMNQASPSIELTALFCCCTGRQGVSLLVKSNPSFFTCNSHSSSPCVSPSNKCPRILTTARFMVNGPTTGKRLTSSAVVGLGQGMVVFGQWVALRGQMPLQRKAQVSCTMYLSSTRTFTSDVSVIILQ